MTTRQTIGPVATDTEPVEWLEDEPPSPELRRRQRQVVLGLAAAAVVLAVGFAFVTPRLGVQPPMPSPTPTPASSSTRSLPTSRATPPAVTSWSVTDFLAELDVDLFARSADTVFRIQTRTGRVTATRVAAAPYEQSISFVAAPDRVLLVSWGEPVGAAVPDGRPPRPLTGLLVKANVIYPGPNGRVWVSTDPDGQSTMQLVDATGRPSGPLVDGNGAGLVADGRGGLMMTDVGGSYSANAGGLARISRGSVTAVGRTHLMIVDCDARYRCSSYLYDRRSQERRRLGPLRPNQGPYGSLSDDGRHAALFTWLPRGAGFNLTIIETSSGRSLAKLRSDGFGQGDNGSTVWLPDGRLVGIHKGRLFTFDPRSGSVGYPDLKLPGSLIQLTIRDQF